jgi:hypothetical protein
VSILREFGWHPVWRENSNVPDVRIATIDRIAGHLRRRSDDGEEAFGVNDNASRWLRVSGGRLNDLSPPSSRSSGDGHRISRFNYSDSDNR